MRHAERERRPERTHASDLVAPVPAAVEEERLAFGGVAELDDATDDDHVVAGVVFRFGLAVDVRERVGEDGAPVDGRGGA